VQEKLQLFQLVCYQPQIPSLYRSEGILHLLFKLVHMRLLLIIPLLLLAICGNPCTTFLLKEDGLILFGRNYDWVTDAGIVCTNLKGLSKTSLKSADGNTISWVSQYGSITFNQYGKEFPTGGMNEKGLVVELMWLEETKYPAPDDRAAIGVLQWIQYQLDNCATIEEVIATDKKLRISATGNAPLHYLVADATGAASTIEFLNGKMVVHKGKDLKKPVLTNSAYAESINTFENASVKKSGSNFEYGNNSLERFGQACSMVSEFSKRKAGYSAVTYAFDILSKVAQGNATKWSIVYDITNKTIRFKTYRFNDVKQVNFSSFDFTCKGSSKAWDMNQAASGNISALFKDYSPELNRRIVETSISEGKSTINIPDALKEANLTYSAAIKCQ
jgi:penicillin V acylase-like amidase (Ntn superfamily)